MALQRHEGTNIPSGKRGYRIYYRYSDRYVLSARAWLELRTLLNTSNAGRKAAVELFWLDLANSCVALSSTRPLIFNRCPRTNEILGIFLHRASTASDPLECMSRAQKRACLVSLFAASDRVCPDFPNRRTKTWNQQPLKL
jgi:hypothetical protein